MPAGQHWYVSVIVVKGTKAGKRIALISGVHGDEISSVHTIQTVMSQLDPAEMSGSVVAVPDVSRPALETMARRWPNSGRGIDLIDTNREWPGNENGASAPSRQAGLLFNRPFKPNVDRIAEQKGQRVAGCSRADKRNCPVPIKRLRGQRPMSQSCLRASEIV
jgi:uncharacterized protein